MQVRLGVLTLTLLGGCQIFVPVDEVRHRPDAGRVDAGRVNAGVDAGTVGADAGTVDADAGTVDADAGTVDAGTVDAGGVDGGADAGGLDAGGEDGGVDGGPDAGPPTCATLRCSPWSICVEDAGGGGCEPAVVSIQWAAPSFNADVPLDMSRLEVALEVTGAPAVSVPVNATGAGQSTTVASRSDGGLALGSLSFTSVDAGALVLTAGWSGGPQATTVVNVLPTRALEIVGANPPGHGINTADFEPNDPVGAAWRRDDLVPIRTWPGVLVLARHDQPDASLALITSQAGCDGGCSVFRLQDVEFDAFRGNVELRVSTDAGWEARVVRLPVTRWRWRRVVAGVPNPLEMQLPVLSEAAQPGPVLPTTALFVGSEDGPGVGRLMDLDEEGVPSGRFSAWDAAVTAPMDGRHRRVFGFHSGSAFMLRASVFPPDYLAVGSQPVKLSGAAGNWGLGLDRSGRLWRYHYLTGATDVGSCPFDGGLPARMVVHDVAMFAASAEGAVCFWTVSRTPVEAGPAIRPSTLIGPWSAVNATAASGAFVELGWNWESLVVADGGPTDLRVLLRDASEERSPGQYFGLSSTAIQRWPVPNRGDSQLRGPPAESAPLLAPPVSGVLRRFGAGNLVYWLDTAGALHCRSSPGLAARWSQVIVSADGGSRPPIMYAPSRQRLGSIIIVDGPAVLSVVAEGTLPQPLISETSWWMSGSQNQSNCHTLCNGSFVF